MHQDTDREYLLSVALKQEDLESLTFPTTILVVPELVGLMHCR